MLEEAIFDSKGIQDLHECLDSDWQECLDHGFKGFLTNTGAGIRIMNFRRWN